MTDEDRLGYVSYSANQDPVTRKLGELTHWLKDRFQERNERSRSIIEETKAQKARLEETIDRVSKLPGIEL